MALKPIETAPKDKRVLVWDGHEVYAAHWARHMITDDGAWVIAQFGDGEQVLVKPTHWMPLPKDGPPRKIHKADPSKPPVKQKIPGSVSAVKE